MKNVLRFTISTAVALSLLGASSPRINNNYLVRLNLDEFRAHARQIKAAGLDVAGLNMRRQTADVIVNDDGLRILQTLGVRGTDGFAKIPMRAPDAKFKTPEQVAQILANYAHAYPDLAQVASIGKSLQGRDIYAIKITQHVAQMNSAKPAVLFNGMHHAREVMATEVPLDIIDTLLTNYGKDAHITHWVDSNVIYVVPMLNVDGNHIVWTQDNMWRKNARGNYGVDINRNYPFQWNTCNGSSGSQEAQDYRGPAPASEPETNVLMNFVKSINPVFDISFHSYSEIVIYPYGCGQHTDKPEVVETIGKQMASLIKNDAGDGTYVAGLAPDLLYPVDGDDLDWMYHEAHVIPYVIEVNSDSQGFQPDYDQWRDSTVNRVRPGWEYLLDRLDHTGVRGIVVTPRGSSYAPMVRVERLNTDAAPYVETHPVHYDGTFHLVLTPGIYRITVGGVEYAAVQRIVRVGNDRVNVHVVLRMQ